MSAARVSAARTVAFDVLGAVRTQDAYANLALPARLRRAGLSGADAAFATELTYGTLRMQGFYDAVVGQAARRDARRIDNDVLDILRLGCHQLLGMSVAEHAAVNESVTLASRVTRGRAAGFVNAVLRAVQRRSRSSWVRSVSSATRSETQRLATVHSHPRWVVSALRRALGADGREEQIEPLLAANNRPAAVTLAAYDGADSLAAPLTPGAHSPYAFTLGGGDPAVAIAEARGPVRVQDEGSQLAGLVLSRARPVRPGERWLDLCAGPGGKAALLAAEIRGTDAELVANELVPARVGLVQEAVAAVSEDVVVWESDGRTVGQRHPERFDRILLDAPCTGLGALRRRPEARWRKSARDLEDLTALQSELIDSAVAALRPGGLLAYVTCSPHTAETRDAIAGALERHAGVISRRSAVEAMQGVAATPVPELAGPDVQLWSHAHGTDAMFVSLLTKTDR